MAREFIVVLSQAAGTPIIRSTLEVLDMATSVTNPGIRDLIPKWIVDARIVNEPVPDGLAVEDGSALTRQAWEMLKSEKQALKLPDLEIYPLAEFIRGFPFPLLTVEQKTAIVDQAILIFQHLYPHLPFKQQQFMSAEPLQMLRGLRANLASKTEVQFHNSMIRAFNGVVDTHTIYGVPPPYGGAVAFLPFQLKAFQDKDGRDRFAVTRLMKTQDDGSFGHPLFAPGATITHLNWFAAQFYIQESPDRLPAGNPVSRAARGANSATLRPLTFCPLPTMVPLEQLPAAANDRPVFGSYQSDRLLSMRPKPAYLPLLMAGAHQLQMALWSGATEPGTTPPHLPAGRSARRRRPSITTRRDPANSERSGFPGP